MYVYSEWHTVLCFTLAWCLTAQCRNTKRGQYISAVEPH